MSKSAIYAANTAVQTIAAAGTTINFGSIVRRFGCLDLSGGNVITNCEGYYSVDTNFTVRGSGNGTVIIQLYSNGVAIPGAVATTTTATGSINSLSIPTEIRQKCCVSETITAVASGAVADITNAAIVVAKD